MLSLWPIALITFKEGIRNRAIYGISLFALMLLSANFLLAQIIPIEVGKVAVDFSLSTVSFAGLLFVLFIGINLMAKDLEKKTIYMILSRPLSRSQYIYGKFFGMILLICTMMVLLTILTVLSLIALKGIYPYSFNRISLYMVCLAICGTTLMLILLSALSFLFASFTSSSFITLVFTILAYLIGQSTQAVKNLVEMPQAAGIEVSPVTAKMVQAAYYLFPNLSLFDIKIQAAHGLDVTISYIVWTLLYGVIYTAITILLAAMIFRKKEFP
jgi:ABC-type transport system involved in multi-copper enzyme maturation permease subunit